MSRSHVLITFPEADGAAEWLKNPALPPGAKARWVVVQDNNWHDNEYQFADAELLPAVIESATEALADAKAIKPGQWPQLPLSLWPESHHLSLLHLAINRWSYLGDNGADHKAIVDSWRNGELESLGGYSVLEQALNLTHPTGQSCRCPACETHDSGCECACCKQPDVQTDCSCRQVRTKPPDFILETAGGYTIAWPATHAANGVSEASLPEHIHHSGDRLITAMAPDQTADYLLTRNLNSQRLV